MLVIFGCGVSNIDFGKVCVVRTLLTLKLCPAVFINQSLRFLKRCLRLKFRQIRTVDDFIYIQWCIHLCYERLVYGISVSAPV